MTHAPVFAALAAALVGARSSAVISDTAGASAKIVQSGGFAVVSPLVLPSVVAVPATGEVQFAAETPAAGTSGGQISGNARLTVRRDTGEAVSLDVPPSFAVVRTGGDETLTVKTVTKGDLTVVGDGVLLGGAMVGGSAASVDIGGKLALASSDKLVPGPYSGLIVVVVQYN